MQIFHFNHLPSYINIQPHQVLNPFRSTQTFSLCGGMPFRDHFALLTPRFVLNNKELQDMAMLGQYWTLYIQE